MRKLDSKFSIDGDRIIKTSNGEAIPENEPVFLLRSRDRLALPLLKIYAQLSEVDGCNDYHFTALSRTIRDFESFKEENADLMKQPSVTRGK